MGFNPIKTIKKAAKKIWKSDAGKVAIGLAALNIPYGAAGAKQSAWQRFLPYAQEAATGAGGILEGIKTGWGKMPLWKQAAAIGIGTGAAAGIADEPLDEPLEEIDDRGHKDYLRTRVYFEDEWADWLVEEGKAATKEEALTMVRNNPMFSGSEGGRVGAQAGMYAGNPMMNRGIGNPMMNQMRGQNPMMRGNPMMNQPRGALVGPSNLAQNQGLMATQQGNQMRGDPRMMAQLMQGQRTTGLPKETEDDELIMLIKQLIAMGYEMEQLRGRTKEELVQMMVAASGPVDKGEGEVVEEEEVMTAADGGRVKLGGGSRGWNAQMKADEIAEGMGYDSFYDLPRHLQDKVYSQALMEIDEGLASIADMRRKNEAEGGLMRTGYALGQPVIPSKDGMQLDMRDQGGYQPLGKQEKKDDVRALLAQGEFVMTSDAVRGLGGGDREVGAKKMYDMMHNLEAMA